MSAKPSVDPPYHFGWKIESDESQGKGDQGYTPAGTWQEVDLNIHKTDIILYKGEVAVGWWKMRK